MVNKGILAGSILAISAVAATAIYLKKDEIFPPSTTPPGTTPPGTEPPGTTPPPETDPGTILINSLSVNPKSGNKPLAVGFNLDVKGVPEVIEWHYGDGQVEIGSFSKTHTYYSEGTFNGKVKVTNKAGISDERSFTITVNPTTPPGTPSPTIITNFYQNKSTVLQNQTVAFSIALGEPFSNISEIRWKWGDGSADLVGKDNSILTVDHLYSKVGTFSGSVIGKTLDGKTETRTFIVAVEGDPTQTITVKIILSEFFGTTINVGEQFRAWIDRTGGISPYIYEIDFGDGTILFQQDSYHTYSKSGNYTIKATVKDATGKSFSTSRSITVDVSPLQVGDAKFVAVPPASAPNPVKLTYLDGFTKVRFDFNARVKNLRTDRSVSVKSTAIIQRLNDHVTLITKDSSTITIAANSEGTLTGYIGEISLSNLPMILVFDLDDASGQIVEDLDKWTAAI